jgi:colicin import membrane protein
MELQIDKFTPQKAELQTLAAQYSALTIAGIQDKAGYKIVDEARKDLKRKRVEITKTGKELREEAVAFQKKVITVEKELVALIEPVELDLATKQEAIDKAIQMEKRRESLPYRQEQLKELGVVVADEFLLIMEDAAYLAFVTEKKAEKVAEQERQLKEQQEALAKAQAKLEEDKRLEAAKIEAANREREAAAQAAVQAAAKAEQDKLAAVEAERKKAADERAALVAEQEQKERDRQAAVEAEAKAKKEAEEQAKAEKAKLEAKKKYQAWLSSNDYVEDGSCLLRQEGTEMVFYRKVATYKL